MRRTVIRSKEQDGKWECRLDCDHTVLRPVKYRRAGQGQRVKDPSPTWTHCKKCQAPALGAQLQELKEIGCHPSITRRGDLWRAYVNWSGAFWEDDADPSVALSKARAAWEAAGRPMDGAAATEAVHRG